MQNDSNIGRKLARPVGGNRLRYTLSCKWCGCPFACTRPDAKTCSVGHRSQLARYVRKNGHDPLFPFGLKPDAVQLGKNKSK